MRILWTCVIQHGYCGNKIGNISINQQFVDTFNPERHREILWTMLMLLLQNLTDSYTDFHTNFHALKGFCLIFFPSLLLPLYFRICVSSFISIFLNYLINIYYAGDTLSGLGETEIEEKKFKHWESFLSSTSVSNMHKPEADITLKHRKLSFSKVKIVQILAALYGLT